MVERAQDTAFSQLELMHIPAHGHEVPRSGEGRSLFCQPAQGPPMVVEPHAVETFNDLNGPAQGLECFAAEQTKTHMKAHFIFPIVCALGALFTSCASEPGKADERTTEQLQENQKELAKAAQQSAEEWREESAEAARELRELREDLVKKQAREEKRLADGIKDATKKAECEARIAELRSSITRVDAALARVEGSNDSNWADVKRESRKVVDDTKSWIEREAEKVDWKTDADADDDGH